ncbi:MAG: hypothetical protein J6S67_12815 [Methanobrevibacter sp.]|nr:hypothetical protein [Methanobrevibacter sp.]
MNTQQKIVCHKIADNYGLGSQLPIAIEEMSELTKEICKYIRGNDNEIDIAEEVADVKIMIEQIVYLFGIDDKVNKQVDYKLNRQLRRMDSE